MLYFPTVTSDLIGGSTIIVNEQLPSLLERFPPDERKVIVGDLEKFIKEVEAVDGTGSTNIHVGIKNSNSGGDFQKDHVLEKTYWQLAMFYRYLKPTRIAEAIPALQFVISIYKKCNPNTTDVDVVPTLYLGVALAKAGENDEEALNVLEQALRDADSSPRPSPKNSLWARAHLSRLLRKMKKTSEAEQVEALIRNWILFHPYAMPPSEFLDLVTDETVSGTNHILNHPDMKDTFANVIFEDRRAGVAIFR
ncbi:hypothetical protein Hypma_000701 [Hypsizygus marmoreus]|uniref:Uncharacterized protein n=1 Tax=Hypsizygus marmoreus TaxID=39966 RepID=A0A369J7J6_HYPMA|nr:hypothetical protein Hypma_000701 [Hypsizygus marmoreus]